jgi:transposase-like protein
MTPERCPKCGARNTRVRHEYELHGWVQPDDYCGRCGVNWPRPRQAEAEKIVPMAAWREEDPHDAA